MAIGKKAAKEIKRIVLGYMNKNDAMMMLNELETIKSNSSYSTSIEMLKKAISDE